MGNFMTTTTAREQAVITNQQRERLEALQMEFRRHADATRELDCLADLIQNKGRTFSAEAHDRALMLLRSLERVSAEQRDQVRDQLKAAEGWQTVR